MTSRQHPLIPQSGGFLVECEPLELLRRLPDGVIQLVYLDPPFLTGLAVPENVDKFVADYRQMVEDLLKHAKRVLKSDGNLFVRFPQRHEFVDMNAALSQVFSSRRPHLITVPAARQFGQSVEGPTTRRETIFLVRVSDDSVYNPILLPAELKGSVHADGIGPYQWDSLTQRMPAPHGRTFEFRGVTPPQGSGWRFSRARMEEMDARGRIGHMKSGVLAMKRYAADLRPIAASLEWDGLPSLMASNGHRDPLPVLDRMLRLGSDEGDLVVMAQLAEIGSGAATANHLKRRWVATIASETGMEACRIRLENAGAIPGFDFRTVTGPQLQECGTFAVSGPPLLLSPESMVTAATKVEAIRRSVEGAFASELERQLAGRLVELGVVSVANFREPGTNRRFDFFLPTPPFGVIELKAVQGNPDYIAAKLEDFARRLPEIRRGLGDGTRVYLAVIGPGSGKLRFSAPLPDGVLLFAADDDIGALADRIAADFQSHAVHMTAGELPTKFAQMLLEDQDELSSTLSHLALNLEALFLADGRKVLEHEVAHLRDEIGHQHFTAAALRVGRTVEFIIYAACRSWDVQVREPILVGLARLDGGFQEITNALLMFSAIDLHDPKRKDAKKKVVSAITALQKMTTEVVSDVDECAVIDPEAERSPRNPQALVNDIVKRYQAIKEVRAAGKEINVPLTKLLKLRNSAAHASTDGDAREVGRDQLKAMIDLLNEVLFCLSKCGTAIGQNRQIHARSSK